MVCGKFCEEQALPLKLCFVTRPDPYYFSVIRVDIRAGVFWVAARAFDALIGAR